LNTHKHSQKILNRDKQHLTQPKRSNKTAALGSEHHIKKAAKENTFAGLT
jgi:hypothetical protein